MLWEPFKGVNQIGADARVIMPFHSQMKGKYGAQTRHLADFNINFSGGETYVGVEELVYNEVTYYLIDNEGFLVMRYIVVDLQKESSMLSSAVP